MTFDFSLVKAERLAKYHDLSQFDCEDEDINDFIKSLMSSSSQSNCERS